MISKKDLLKETGISYGQLYRWKRAGLIPEAWFVKQSSYTGQETFFPRDKVLDRIRSIQELKDDYSLDELAAMLSPEMLANSIIEEEALVHNHIFSNELLENYKIVLNKTRLKYIDVIILYTFTELIEEGSIKTKDAIQLLKINKENILAIQDVHQVLIVAEYEKILFLFISSESKVTFIDSRFKNKVVKSLEVMNNKFKKRFRSIL